MMDLIDPSRVPAILASTALIRTLVEAQVGAAALIGRRDMPYVIGPTHFCYLNRLYRSAFEISVSSCGRKAV